MKNEENTNRVGSSYYTIRYARTGFRGIFEYRLNTDRVSETGYVEHLKEISRAVFVSITLLANRKVNKYLKSVHFSRNAPYETFKLLFSTGFF